MRLRLCNDCKGPETHGIGMVISSSADPGCLCVHVNTIHPIARTLANIECALSRDIMRILADVGGRSQL